MKTGDFEAYGYQPQERMECGIPQAARYDDARFPIRVSREREEERPLMDAIRDAKTHLYLIGSGGIGKTTALLRIMEEAYDEEKSKNVEQNRLNG